MKTYFSTYFNLIIFSLLFVACSTPQHQRISQVRKGMDKSDVLDIIGGPNAAKRKNGKDVWIYIYYEKNEKKGKQYTFNKGHLIEIADYSFAPDLESQISDSDTFKEYEKKIKSDRESSSEEYKDISEDE